MAYSKLFIENNQALIQLRIDARNIGDRFEFKERFSDDEWTNFTENLRYATSIPTKFKERVIGFVGAKNPVFSNVVEREVKVNGRVRMFERTNGNAQVGEVNP